MVQAFETHLREIVLRAQAQVLAQLQQKLSITDGTIDATPANMRVMRNAGPLFMDEMRRQGYDRLVEAFAGEFRGTLPFLQETIQQLGEQVQKEWPDLGFGAKDLNLLAATQANAAVSIEAAVESVAGTAMTRGLFSVAGLRFGELAEMLTEKFETSIGKARTIADTSMSTFYATATDRAFQIIEKDLPEQVQHYKYSGPDDKLTRPFCEHLLKLGKAYTREEIGKMDNGQLPNVMITRGGWNCRHQWILAVDEMIGSVNENLVGAGSLLGTPAADISRPVRSAVSASNRVHKVPELAGPVPVVSDAAMVEGAKYRWDTMTGCPLDIRLNPRGDHAELSTVLEIGHLLDHQAIGVPGTFASEIHPIMAGWRRAINSTRAVQKLEDLREAGSIPFKFSDGVVRPARVRDAANDLLHPWELFSRSYAQFIAESSGSEKLAAQIQGFRNPENPSSVVPQFWDEDDFENVSVALKRLIIELGWKK